MKRLALPRAVDGALLAAAVALAAHAGCGPKGSALLLTVDLDGTTPPDFVDVIVRETTGYDGPDGERERCITVDGADFHDPLDPTRLADNQILIVPDSGVTGLIVYVRTRTADNLVLATSSRAYENLDRGTFTEDTRTLEHIVARALLPLNGAATPDLTPTFIWDHAIDELWSPSYDFQLTSDCAGPGPNTCTPSLSTGVTHLEVTDAGTSGGRFTPSVPLPVDMLPVVGRRWYWRVRACDRTPYCTDYSPWRYVDVGRWPGDLTGDGFSDVVVGAPGADEGTTTETGAAYVFAGSMPFAPLTGARITGGALSMMAGFGSSIGRVGDLDGDGDAELVVGAPGSDTGTTMGQVFVFDDDATPGVALDNPAGAGALPGFGAAVAGAGDFNRDGRADVVVGDPIRSGKAGVEVGTAYVFFGTATGLDAQPLVLEPFVTLPVGAHFGASVASAGDVNGDGFADVLVGAPGSPGGAFSGAFLFMGGPGVGPGIGGSDLDDGVLGPGPDGFGASVAGPGDLDGDGVCDFLVGAPGDEGNGTNRGSVALFRTLPYGGAVPFTPTETLFAPDPMDGAAFGASVSGAGDLDGDELADFIVGAPGHGPPPGAGRAYVFGGRLNDLPQMLATLQPPIEQMDASFGGGFWEGVSSAGDVDGDGILDLLAGATGYNGDSGGAWVFHGPWVTAPASTSLHILVVLIGGDRFGVVK
jgi:hypothetical protein